MPPTSVTQVQFWPRVVCGLSFSRSQPDSEGFSPGTPVFLPQKNRLPVNYIRLGLRCSGITHGSYGGSHGRLRMHSVRSRWAGWLWKALVGSGQLSAHLHLHLHIWMKDIKFYQRKCTLLKLLQESNNMNFGVNFHRVQSLRNEMKRGLKNFSMTARSKSLDPPRLTQTVWREAVC